MHRNRNLNCTILVVPTIILNRLVMIDSIALPFPHYEYSNMVIWFMSG